MVLQSEFDHSIKIIEEKLNKLPHLPKGQFHESTISIIVVVLFLSNMFFNIDMGILPAGSIKIKEDLQLDNSQFGTLGSVAYFG